MENFMKAFNQISEEKQFDSIENALKKAGVDGFLILNQSGAPFIIRNYNQEGIIRVDNAELLTAFISALNSYANSIGGLLSDIGFGSIRMIMKRTSREFIFCLFVNEILSRRITGEELMMLVEITLQNIVKHFDEAYPPFIDRYSQAGVQKLKSFSKQIDELLYEAFLMAQYFVMEGFTFLPSN